MCSRRTISAIPARGSTLCPGPRRTLLTRTRSPPRNTHTPRTCRSTQSHTSHTRTICVCCLTLLGPIQRTVHQAHALQPLSPHGLCALLRSRTGGGSGGMGSMEACGGHTDSRPDEREGGGGRGQKASTPSAWATTPIQRKRRTRKDRAAQPRSGSQRGGRTPGVRERRSAQPTCRIGASHVGCACDVAGKFPWN